MRKADFEHVVVGSSPMMLMQARELALLGQSVCVLDSNARLGGAWQTAEVGSENEVEIACHVIEVFPQVYEYLEEASGVQFVELDVQPVRITRNGRQLPYFSRLLLTASGARMAIGYARALLVKMARRNEADNDLINYRTKLTGFLRFQLQYLVSTPKMKGPKYGFADYIARLEERCREVGVTFCTCEVSRLEQQDAIWALGQDGADSITAREVHLTTSCGLRQIAPDRFEAMEHIWHERGAFVVDIVDPDLEIPHTYVAFWADPQVSRISRIDMRETGMGFQRFLIEMRNRDILDAPDLLDLLRAKLEAARILKPNAAFRPVGPVLCLAKQNIDQLPLGSLAPGVNAYSSNGNLAAGIAYWLRHQKPRLDLRSGVHL